MLRALTVPTTLAAVVDNAVAAPVGTDRLVEVEVDIRFVKDVISRLERSRRLDAEVNHALAGNQIDVTVRQHDVGESKG